MQSGRARSCELLGGARQCEQSGRARPCELVGLWALWPSVNVACVGLTPCAAWPVQSRWARQSELLGSWRCGLGGVPA